MTASQLLVYIAAPLLLQMTAGVCFIIWRRRAALGEGPAVAATTGPASAAGAWPGWREFRVSGRNFEDAAQSQCSFRLQPVDGEPLAPFLPGQYLTFSLMVPDSGVGTSGGARAITRCYSLSDRPNSAGYRITIKRVPPPAARPELPPGVSSTHFHDRVHEGDVLKVKAPGGHFFIDPDVSVPAVFVAGGIGITPMMSMLSWCAAEQAERRVHLFYGVRSSADHAFKPVLEDLARSHPALRLHVIYSNPGPGDVLGQDFQHAGRIDLALLRNNLPHGRHQFYVCGPPAMMQSLVPALREWGVRDGHVHLQTP